jgi:hypothetical protein
MPRFVILRHETSEGVHFDFMLEAGDVLKTWSLPEEPRLGMEMECEALADHRRAYLDYEGPISGGRGSVTQWDSGDFTLERQTDMEWVLSVAGKKVAGRIGLNRAAKDSNRWSFSCGE